MSSREFSEWQAFTTVEMIGEDRQDFRLARLLAFLANVVGILVGRKKRERQVFEPRDFMPTFWEAVAEPEQSAEPERQAWQQQLQYIEMWNAALGGKDIRQ
jgi:hypothetical protein